ncbi:unnamed protein product [Microthlaspi erraticum]|uniref:Uncharacterized protein n=1 Tax=Microthlaspi erraticum TaxID=1685480 RepID=A0A6D2KB97_9BRAS|nr:unnamed protein product [Microthlaspi erraticum]
MSCVLMHFNRCFLEFIESFESFESLSSLFRSTDVLDRVSITRSNKKSNGAKRRTKSAKTDRIPQGGRSILQATHSSIESRRASVAQSTSRSNMVQLD